MIYWDPNPDLFIIPVLNWPIKWYGFFFALGFALGFPIFKQILLRYFQTSSTLKKEPVDSLKKIALQITDRLTIYMVIATILGAKIGHFLFYEDPKNYFHNPLEIILSREGLASHGAAIAILFGLWMYSRQTKMIEPGLGWLRLLDFICIPTALAGGFIRLGNFMNQEILGTPTEMPWGGIFGHPADGSFPLARHPVQLYEAIIYFAVFFVIWRLSFRSQWLRLQGGIIGLFLTLVFSFRFLIEFFKEEQSHLLHSVEALKMGQWLSIPFVLLGIYLLVQRAFAKSD